MQNLLAKQLDIPKQEETALAIAAYVPAMVAILSDFPPIWVIAALIYTVVGYTSFTRWSRLLVSWWSGWALLMFIYTAVQLLPVFQPLSTTYLLGVLAILTLITFALITARDGDVLFSAIAILPVSLELGRFALFRDLVNGFWGAVIMTVVATVVYAAIVLTLMHGRTRNHSWWLITAGIAVYGVTAIIASWPMILGYVLFYNYLPLLFLLFVVPLFGPLMLENLQRLSRFEGVPHTVGRIVLPVMVLMLCSVLTAVFLLSPAVSGANASLASSESRQKVIVDTDMSFDDYVAILYLLQHPEVDVVGVNSVHGVATTAAGTENIRRLLSLVGREEIPVGMGAADPLEGERVFPAIWTTVMDSALRPALPTVEAKQLPTAPVLMEELIAQSPEEITVVALGPLTNVAQLFQQTPQAAEQLKSLVVGGGAIEAENPTPDGEKDWNLWLDPLANEIVLNSNAPMVWTPLDLTHYDLRLDQGFAQRWRTSQQQPETMMMVRIPWMMIAVAGQSQPVWDLVTAVMVTDPEICSEWRALSLSSIQGAGETAGFLTVSESGAPNASVCMDGDQELFETSILLGTR